jgi:hypothetical protein
MNFSLEKMVQPRWIYLSETKQGIVIGTTEPYPSKETDFRNYNKRYIVGKSNYPDEILRQFHEQYSQKKKSRDLYDIELFDAVFSLIHIIKLLN